MEIIKMKPYTILALLSLACTPLSLFSQKKDQVQDSASYSRVLTYSFEEEWAYVEQGRSDTLFFIFNEKALAIKEKNSLSLIDPEFGISARKRRSGKKEWTIKPLELGGGDDFSFELIDQGIQPYKGKDYQAFILRPDQEVVTEIKLFFDPTFDNNFNFLLAQVLAKADVIKSPDDLPSGGFVAGYELTAEGPRDTIELVSKKKKPFTITIKQ